MDRELLRRKALLAAGSVALAAGLAGCILPDDDAVAGDTGKADTALADTSGTDTSGGKPDCTEVYMSDTGAYAECCDALTAWCEAEHGSGTDAANECTYGPGYDGSTGCIPWGPPVSPRFRGAMA